VDFLHGPECLVKRCLADLQPYRCFAYCQPFADQLPRTAQLLLSNNGSTSASAAACRCGRQARSCALPDQVSLELPEGSEQMEHQPAAERGGVDHLGERAETSDHVFILCTMLGFRFCPRLRDFPDRKLACIEPATAYKDLQPILGRRIRTDVIREHWDDVLRLVASLQADTVLPSAMLKRLAAFQRQNQLDLALQELGRIERTLFMLDWLESPQLRQLCQAGLNKSEQRHALAQVICTFKQGRIADRGQDAQQFRASGLNLAIAAIVYWNSTYLADAIVHLGKDGKLLQPELLAHTSPLMWEHVGFSGDFLWDRAAATAAHRRPLNLGRERLAA